jgi:hypothetical protein
MTKGMETITIEFSNGKALYDAVSNSPFDGSKKAFQLTQRKHSSREAVFIH